MMIKRLKVLNLNTCQQNQSLAALKKGVYKYIYIKGCVYIYIYIVGLNLYLVTPLNIF